MFDLPHGSKTRIAPLAMMAFAVAIGVGVCVVVTLFAADRPWLGMQLTPADEETGARVVSVKGPSADIPEGIVIKTLESSTDRMELTPFDLTTEPDGMMGDYSTYLRFLERQSRLARIQDSPEVVFTAADGTRFPVMPEATRPLQDLPVDFWVQCFVGLAAWLVSAAVFAFRPKESAAKYLLLSGMATLMFAPAAAVYTTRELAVHGEVLQRASDLNFLGGSLFAASFVALLLVHPRRIAPGWAGPAVVAVFLLWFIAQQVGIFESMTFARRFLVMLGVLTTFVLAGVHWRTSRRDPLARAALQWFLLSWVMGTGLFAMFILLPQTLGIDTSPIQGYAFLLFLLVYGGLAFGILRYRLFELGDWWRRVIAWTTAMLALVILDALFFYCLHLSIGASLALALLICGGVWLPLRVWLWQRFTARRENRTKDLFGKVMDIAAAVPGGSDREHQWRELMADIFRPLEISPSQSHAVAICDDGVVMEIPSIADIGGLRLEYARNGHGLFGPSDSSLAEELVSMLAHGIESLRSYQKGAAEERARIARDMHDNIGAHLLAALHSKDNAAKDAKIRETLTDLREVINQMPYGAVSINEMLAELRMETAERVEAAGMALQWDCSINAPQQMSSALNHTLRSIIREGISNAIRHSGGSNISVSLKLEGGMLRLEIEDDGCGFDPEWIREGNGLMNIKSRVRHLDGAFNIARIETGIRLTVRLPLDQSPVLK